MSQEQQEIAEQKGIGGTMITAMWIILLALMAFMFNYILDQQHNPNQNIHTYSGTDGSNDSGRYAHGCGHGVVGSVGAVAESRPLPGARSQTRQIALYRVIQLDQRQRYTASIRLPCCSPGFAATCTRREWNGREAVR